MGEIGVEYVFFWDHRIHHGGRVDPGCLDQWWPSPFTVDGLTYATAEHYMMWSKAVGCGDTASAAVILGDPDPQHAQATGRRLSNFDYAVWERRRFDVVVAGNRAKFGQHAELRNFLLSTQEKVLVEASADDQLWGIGLGEEEARATDPRG